MDPQTSDIDINALLAMDAEDVPDDTEPNPVSLLMPYLQQYGMITKSITADEVTATDLKELTIRWNLKIRDKRTRKDLSFDKLLNQLMDHVMELRQGAVHVGAGTGTKVGFDATAGKGMAMSQSMPELKPKKFMRLKNYFGMPDYAYDSNASALIYASRKTRRDKEMDNEEEEHHEEQYEETKKEETKTGDTKKKASMVSAQRKVSEALMTMVENEDMAPHFMHKGGVEAVIKLLSESDDSDVLTTCTQCLLVATETAEYCKVLNDKRILSNLQGLLDSVDGDFDVCLSIARTITNMSYCGELGELLVMGGIVSIVQGLFIAATTSGSYDIFFYCMLTMNNIGPALSGPDAELCLKILMSCTKKLDVARHYNNALFAIDVFVNFTRNFQYHIILLEEGVLPLMIHTLEAYMTLPMMGRICEGFVNLSCTRKNRRELASSGIAGFLDRIFSSGTPSMRAHILSMIGNLLSSGFFHDKTARDDAINPMLKDMLVLEQPVQFTAVAFVVSQLAQVGTSATVMVRCGAVRRILDLIEDAPADSKRYLWTVLAALSQQPKFFDNMTGDENGRDLIKEMFKESMIEKSDVIALVVQLAYNLAQRDDLGSRFPLVTCEQFVALLKTVFVREVWALKEAAISTLINFTIYTKSVRVEMLGGGELISMFEEVGIDNPIMNIKYAACLNICSNEANLCIKMLDNGAQKFLVAIQSTITAMPVGDAVAKKSDGGSRSSNAPGTGSVTGELGRAITAATLHNLSLKRAALGPGTLTTLMRLLKNNKTLRILHCVRMLARVSVHAKAKLALTKEKSLIPLLTAVMRSGCEEADRVQHYCALTICNTLACQINREIMEDLIAKGAITDLVVCTLLRINSVYTKESLGKGLFNLMSRADFRDVMVKKLDVLTAMLELAKIENLELLELCIRSCYNVSCEYKEYAEKMKELKLANILVARTTHSSLILGAKATTAVKALCGMTMANMSFDASLAEELVFDKKVADACMEIFKLDSNEATYCAAVTILNMSMMPDSKNLADSKAVPLCVYIIEKGPVECLQMAVAALCNFSMLPVFFDQLTANTIPVERNNAKEMSGAIPAMIGVLATTVMDPKIRLEALQFIYNMTTKHSACWPVCVEASGFEALGKILKSEGTADGKEHTLYRIGRITKELCSAATTEDLVKKMLADGVNSLILKLAKVELIDLKFDLACAIYSLSRSPDKLRVLQADTVDILYWLTVHDCLGHNTPIRRNISRALRNFTACGENGAGAISLSKEERAVTVMKALQRSENEDVQWQLSGGIYNMLQVEEAQEGLLEKGVVGLLLELAAGGYTSVRHVCSACLHMCPSEYMPDLSDPAALSLVLCLLEVDGDKFGELAELAMDEIPYILGNMDKRSNYHPDDPPFKASWVAISCEVDSVFSPALISFPSGAYKEVSAAPPGSGSLSIATPFTHYNGTEFFFGGGEEVAEPEPLDGSLRLTSANLAIAASSSGGADEGHGTVGESKDQQGTRGGSGGGNGLGGGAGGMGESGHFPDGPNGNGYNDGMGPSFEEDSGEMMMDAGFAAPERPEDIAFPKIFSKASLPDDTVGAIYSSSARDAQKSSSFPTRLANESIATNDHMNLSSTVSRK
jgi:hypothetical protein